MNTVTSTRDCVAHKEKCQTDHMGLSFLIAMLSLAVVYIGAVTNLEWLAIVAFVPLMTSLWYLNAMFWAKRM